MDGVMILIYHHHGWQSGRDRNTPDLPRVDVRLGDGILDEAASDLPIKYRIVFRPTRLFVDKGVFLEGKAQNIPFGVDDAGFGSTCPIVKAQQIVCHGFSSFLGYSVICILTITLTASLFAAVSKASRISSRENVCVTRRPAGRATGAERP